MQSQFPQLLKVRYYLKGQCQFLKVNHYLMTPQVSFHLKLQLLVGRHWQLATILGVLIGIIVGALVVTLRVYLTANKGMKDSNTLTFIQLLTPFAVYFIGEELHASGIIAVVVAGLIHGLERDRLIRAQTELQMNYNQIWNTLSYALNGFVFVVLGYIVPEVVMEIIHDEPQNIVFLITTALLIALAIYVFRFVWVYLLFKDFIIQTTFNPI